MSFTKINCFDLEMCCWKDKSETGKKTGEIIEIGLCKIDLEKGSIIKRAQYYVKPEVDEISPFCTNLTGITPAKISKQGRPLKDVLKSIENKFGGNNSTFLAWGLDDQVLFQECINKGLKQPFKNYINLALIDRVLNRRKSKISMTEVMKENNIDFLGNLHSGYDDAYNLGRLALKIL